jgi:DNA-binding transcriptional LysR family regulator
VELGAPLLVRTTRAVVPTEAGVEYLARAESILDQLDEAEQAVRQSELQGTLRISMPTTTAIREIIARLPRFTERHPKLNLQIFLDDRRNDLVRDALDVAIRVGTLPESNAKARLLTTYPRLIVAAPEYLKRAGTPLVPADLPSHRIVYGPAATVEAAWTFFKAGKTESVVVQPSISFSDNEGAVAAAVAGMGVTSIGYWTCRRELSEGALVQILSDWEMVPTRVHAFFPSGRAMRSAARAFIKFLSEEFRGDKASTRRISKG